MVMDFRPEHYHRTALERMEQSRSLYLQGTSYALAMYVAGVAVECLLRAFKLKREPTFEERHDLPRLFKASGMLGVDPAALQANGLPRDRAERYERELQDAVNTVSVLWGNDYRYASEDRMRAHLKVMRRPQRAKGDILKASSLHLIESAQAVIEIGVVLWDISSRRSSRS
jgi:hypothetical protein